MIVQQETRLVTANIGNIRAQPVRGTGEHECRPQPFRGTSEHQCRAQPVRRRAPMPPAAYARNFAAFPLHGRLAMSADTALMPIPGPVDPVPVRRSVITRADGRVELVGLPKDAMRAALEEAGLELKQAKLRAKQ